MTRDRARNRRLVVPAAVAAALLLFLFLYIDDWGRDFTSNEAFLAEDAGDPALRPLSSGRSSAELLEAVRAAAGRIRNWEYVGDAESGNTVTVLFERTNRLSRLKADVAIRIEDLGDRRRVTGESRSRTGFIGDLGANPRALRRFLAELRDVLEGAVAPAGGGATEAR